MNFFSLSSRTYVPIICDTTWLTSKMYEKCRPRKPSKNLWNLSRTSSRFSRGFWRSGEWCWNLRRTTWKIWVKKITESDVERDYLVSLIIRGNLTGAELLNNINKNCPRTGAKFGKTLVMNRCVKYFISTNKMSKTSFNGGWRSTSEQSQNKVPTPKNNAFSSSFHSSASRVTQLKSSLTLFRDSSEVLLHPPLKEVLLILFVEMKYLTQRFMTKVLPNLAPVLGQFLSMLLSSSAPDY